MQCKKCPHHVRHGQVGSDGKSITFKDRCGLKMKDKQACVHFPFPKVFDYKVCEVYRLTFKASVDRNDVVPTHDFQYSDKLTSSSITEMELL